VAVVVVAVAVVVVTGCDTSCVAGWVAACGRDHRPLLGRATVGRLLMRGVGVAVWGTARARAVMLECAACAFAVRDARGAVVS